MKIPVSVKLEYSLLSERAAPIFFLPKNLTINYQLNRVLIEVWWYSSSTDV